MSADKPTILVVDDDEDIREMARIILSAQGMQVVGARDGIEALERLREGVQPALILLDLMMPKVDGLAFLTELRADPRLSGLPVVAMSGNPDAARLSALGTGQCLLKPVRLAELVATVNRFARPPIEGARA